MGHKEDQKLRQLEVKNYLEVSKQAEKRESHSALYEGTHDVKIEFGERFRDDSAQLGKKKTFKPSEKQKEKNEFIDKSQALTKKATAYTYDLHETLTKRTEQKKRIEDMRGDTANTIEEKFALLYSVKFEKRMLTSSNIRAHISEYLTLIESFKELKEIRALSQGTPTGENIDLRLEPISRQMELLTLRVQAFLSKNRVRMDGSVMEDSEKEEEFVYAHSVETTFVNTVREDVDKSRLFDREKVEREAEQLDKAALKAVLEKEDTESAPKINKALFPAFSRLDSIGRIKNIDAMRGAITGIEYALSTYEEEKMGAEMVLKNHEKDKDTRLADTCRKEITKCREYIMECNRLILETKACLLLAEAEAEFVLAETEEEKKKCLKKIKSAEIDYKAVMGRALKDSIASAEIAHVGAEAAVTKEEAINSDSDTKNYAFKNELTQIAQRLFDSDLPGAGELVDKVRAYTSITHYSIGCEEETRLLKEVIAARKQIEGTDATLAEFDKKLAELTGTSTEILEWDAIPKGLKVDALEGLPKIGEGRGTREEQLAKFDHIPEETKAGKQKGSYRNAALTGVRTWVTLDADTPIFAHKPTVNDIRQGKVSNCYMLAATTGLVNYDPEIIKKCIRDNGDGTVTVRLYKPTEQQNVNVQRIPVFVRIPKRVPKLVSGGDILSSGTYWMQLIERAAAQVNMFREDRKGYQSLWYGNGDEWLSILTGAPRETVYSNGSVSGTRFYERGKTEDQCRDDLFESMSHAKEQGLIYHAGTKESAAAGMNSGHAYTVLGTKKVGDRRYVVLRNPYANMSRVVGEDGSVSKSTTFMSSTADITCGQFSMPFEEFLETMDNVTVTDMSKAFMVQTEKVTTQVDGKAVETENVLSLDEVARREAAAVKAKKEGTAPSLEDAELDKEMSDLEDQILNKKTESVGTGEEDEI